MVVRVRIKICLHSGDEVESKALVNTGAETDEPVIALPLELANNLIYEAIWMGKLYP